MESGQKVGNRQPNVAVAPELQIIEMTYDLVKWSCERTEKFPRSHRYMLGDRMMRVLYELLETLVDAKYLPVNQKEPPLRHANRLLETYRFQLRLAKDIRCFSESTFQRASMQAFQIGQQVGNWLNDVEKRCGRR